MKLPCDIVQDLLPLYEDGLCSQATREAVEEHLRECETCGKQHAAVQELVEPEVKVEPEKEKKATAKSFEKVRNRWIASIVVILLLIPVLYLGVGQVRGVGASFSNLRQIYLSNRFMHYMEAGDYEKAFEYLNFEETKQRWLEEGYISEEEGHISEEQLDDFEEDTKARFLALGEELEQAGGIQNVRYIGVNSYAEPIVGDQGYEMLFVAEYKGKERQIILWMTNGGVNSGHANLSLTDPLEAMISWNYTMYDQYTGVHISDENGT